MRRECEGGARGTQVAFPPRVTQYPARRSAPQDIVGSKFSIAEAWRRIAIA